MATAVVSIKRLMQADVLKRNGFLYGYQKITRTLITSEFSILLTTSTLQTTKWNHMPKYGIE